MPDISADMILKRIKLTDRLPVAIIAISVICGAAGAALFINGHFAAGLLFLCIGPAFATLVQWLFMGKGITKRMQTLLSSYENTSPPSAVPGVAWCLTDSTINTIYANIARINTLSEKAPLLMLLAELYIMRGEHEKAVGCLDTARSGISGRDTQMLIRYYAAVIALYDSAGDRDSVLRACEEARPIVEKDYARSWETMFCTLAIKICEHKAKGEYSYALFHMADYMRVYDSIRFPNPASPFHRLERGELLISRAEMYLMSKEYAKAAEYADMGGPMLFDCPYLLARANDLSRRIYREMHLEQSLDVTQAPVPELPKEDVLTPHV